MPILSPPRVLGQRVDLSEVHVRLKCHAFVRTVQSLHKVHAHLLVFSSEAVLAKIEEKTDRPCSQTSKEVC